MSDVFLDRTFEDPMDLHILKTIVADSRGCFGLHRVAWIESFLSADGMRMFCHFRAADAESVRIALRQLDTDMRIHWPGTVHDAPDVSPEDILSANIMVHRSFETPIALEEVQAIEDANAHCLDAHRVRFMRTFFSSDRRRMACLYRAPDAESVRIAQRQATMPVDSVVAVARVTAESLY
jgi:hypothetical protein